MKKGDKVYIKKVEVNTKFGKGIYVPPKMAEEVNKERYRIHTVSYVSDDAFEVKGISWRIPLASGVVLEKASQFEVGEIVKVVNSRGSRFENGDLTFIVGIDERYYTCYCKGCQSGSGGEDTQVLHEEDFISMNLKFRA
jgi:hypothetical protein